MLIDLLLEGSNCRESCSRKRIIKFYVNDREWIKLHFSGVRKHCTDMYVLFSLLAVSSTLMMFIPPFWVLIDFSVSTLTKMN